MKITLFLADFRSFVRNKSFNPEGNEHPVFYCEDIDDYGMIHFYKPVGNVLYCTELMKQGLPKDITLDGLKQEFQAIEVPKQPDSPKQINGTII